MVEHKLDAPKATDKPLDVKQPKTEAAKPVEAKPQFESKDDHVAHIAELALRMKATKPGAETFATDILYHVAAIQDPESHNAAVAAKQKAQAEADALSAKKRGRFKADDKVKVA